MKRCFSKMKVISRHGGFFNEALWCICLPVAGRFFLQILPTLPGQAVTKDATWSQPPLAAGG
jgi:hypothetical protein